MRLFTEEPADNFRFRAPCELKLEVLNNHRKSTSLKITFIQISTFGPPTNLLDDQEDRWRDAKGLRLWRKTFLKKFKIQKLFSLSVAYKLTLLLHSAPFSTSIGIPPGY